jgi:murein DD-endopeptidase MepM/ murein hydrolase activator NlpD
MNIIFLSRRHGPARPISLRDPLTLVLVALALGSLVLVGLAGGYALGYQNGAQVPVLQLDAMREELQSQKAEVVATRDNNQEVVDALAIRMAELNAHIIRLDALGRRLTKMGKLDDGEFDFDTPPALGGPEPTVDAQSVQVPDLDQRLHELEGRISDREMQLGVLENLLLNRNLNEQVSPQGRPIKSGWMSSQFGKRTDPFTGKDAMHWGIDFAGRKGAEIVAVGAGVVTWSGNRHGYGQLVEVNHGNGLVTRYAHNEENKVAVGDQVDKGEVIALMGASGRATGPNLHFEVLRDGRKVNPLEFVQRDN